MNKSQIPNNIQTQNGNAHYDRNFGFGAYLYFGFYDL